MKNKLLLATQATILGLAAFLLAGAVDLVSGQQVVFVVRHADMPAQLEKKDIRDDTSVSEAGRRRAAVLADRLKDAGVSAIYATQALRTAQTAEPLAKALRIEIKSVPSKDTDGLIRRLRDQHGQDKVLVVGHSATVPRILKALGYAEDIKLGGKEFDALFVVVPKSEGPPVVMRIRY